MERIRKPRVRLIPVPPEDEAAYRQAIEEDARLGALLGTAVNAADFLGVRLFPKRVWLEVPIANEAWVARYRVIAEGGRPVVVELRLEPNGDLPAGGIGARSVVSKVKISEHVEENWTALRAKLRARYGKDAINGYRPGQHGKKGKSAKTGRRVEWTDERLARLARRYLELLADKDQLRFGVIETLAAEEDLSPKSVQNRLTQARDRRWLTRSAPGVAGGRLTIRAAVLLSPDDPAKKRGSTSKAKKRTTKAGNTAARKGN